MLLLHASLFLWLAPYFLYTSARAQRPAHGPVALRRHNQATACGGHYHLLARPTCQRPQKLLAVHHRLSWRRGRTFDASIIFVALSVRLPAIWLATIAYKPAFALPALYASGQLPTYFWSPSLMCILLVLCRAAGPFGYIVLGSGRFDSILSSMSLLCIFRDHGCKVVWHLSPP